MLRIFYLFIFFTLLKKKSQSWSRELARHPSSLAGAKRVREPEEVVPIRLGLSLHGPADPHPSSDSCFPPSLSFNFWAGTTASLATGLWVQQCTDSPGQAMDDGVWVPQTNIISDLLYMDKSFDRNSRTCKIKNYHKYITFILLSITIQSYFSFFVWAPGVMYHFQQTFALIKAI